MPVSKRPKLIEPTLKPNTEPGIVIIVLKMLLGIPVPRATSENVIWLILSVK
jgi:hypothetical protein